MSDRARAELSMLPNGAAPAHARQWLRDMLSGFGPSSELLEDTIVVVDELVTNAVVHAATPILVVLEYSPDRCHCSVADRCVDGPLPRLVERADGTGRGLRLVRAIATAWGVERTAAGTTVWAEIGSHASGAELTSGARSAADRARSAADRGGEAAGSERGGEGGGG